MLKILEDKKEYVETFRKSYVKWNNEHPNENLDIMDGKLISYFIWKAYLDMEPRTFRKLKTGSKETQIDPGARDKVLDMLGTDIIKYLKSSNENYSDWHKECVEKFVKNFNTEVLDNKYNPIAFGKGQKIVNMTMKYLATCDNLSNYEKYFIDCHMPLDRYILKWYYNEVSPDTPKKERKCWSNFTFEDYDVIQKKIRKHFEEFGKNPFVEEWEIFEKYKKCIK